MKRSTWIAFLLIVFGLTATVAFSAEWFLYAENVPGYRFYIDKESIQRTPEGTILVWRKTESPDNAVVEIHGEELREIDCSRRRFKILQGTIWGGKEGMKPVTPSKSWEYFGPNDLESALYGIVCVKGKKK
jgi:hypothetical protein